MHKNSLSIEHYFNQWPEWELGLAEPPTIEKKLHGSISNQSYLLSANGQSWTLRIHHHNPLYYASRQQEYQTQFAVNQLHAAPKIVYQHPSGDYRITEYIEGQTLSELSSITEKQTSLLCSTLKKVHTITIDIPSFSYSDCIARYWQAINDKAPVSNANAIGKYEDMLSLCKTYQERYGQQRVLCHNDLNASNILLASTARKEDTHFVILDWEFSGGGIASMDFSGLATELNIDIHKMSALSDIAVDELITAQAIYHYTCKIYNNAIQLGSLSI